LGIGVEHRIDELVAAARAPVRLGAALARSAAGVIHVGHYPDRLLGRCNPEGPDPPLRPRHAAQARSVTHAQIRRPRLPVPQMPAACEPKSPRYRFLRVPARPFTSLMTEPGVGQGLVAQEHFPNDEQALWLPSLQWAHLLPAPRSFSHAHAIVLLLRMLPAPD
jgi:hypothetical protein